jgi:Tfp pilus assembly protein PilO
VKRYRRTHWVIGGTFVMLFAGLYLFGHRPAAARAAALASEVAQRQAELAAAETRARDLAVVETEVERLSARLERFDKRLPSQRNFVRELNAFTNDITQLAQQSAIKKINWVPGVIRRSELFSEQPIMLSFEGDFLSVFTFLQQVESMPRLARVRKLALTSKDSKVGQVEVQASINLYFADTP